AKRLVEQPDPLILEDAGAERRVRGRAEIPCWHRAAKLPEPLGVDALRREAAAETTVGFEEMLRRRVERRRLHVAGDDGHVGVAKRRDQPLAPGLVRRTLV